MVESRLVFTSPEYFATSLISITSIIAEAKHSLQEVTLAPNNTVNGLAWRAPNRADGKCLWSLLGAAVITGREALLDHLHLTIEASGTALDQRHTSREAHFVHMSSRLEIVEGVEDYLESSKPRHGELGVFYVRVMGDNLGVGIELLCRFLGDLRYPSAGPN